MAAQKPALRPAEPMDSVNITRLLKAAYPQAIGHFIGPFDEKSLLSYVNASITNPLAYKSVVEKNGRLLGSMCMAPIRAPWFGGKILLVEAWFCVVDKYLGGEVPELLLRGAANMLDLVGAAGIWGTSFLSNVSAESWSAKEKGAVAGLQIVMRIPNPGATRQ